MTSAKLQSEASRVPTRPGILRRLFTLGVQGRDPGPRRTEHSVDRLEPGGHQGLQEHGLRQLPPRQACPQSAPPARPRSSCHGAWCCLNSTSGCTRACGSWRPQDAPGRPSL